jgi:hypothetical protein
MTVVGVTTTVDGQTLKMVYPADKVALVNNGGTLGIIPEGQEKGVTVDQIFTFGDVSQSLPWLLEK